MEIFNNLMESRKLDFNDTSFSLLMQKRIHKVLLICSSYDAYMLEEDGRIDEQIFNEYVSLNLRYPPIFVQAHSAQEAIKILEAEQIDLVISMLSLSDMDPFQLAHIIKDKFSDIPIVVLTPFSREVTLKLEKEDLSAIDYVFCWLGNADLLLAIIKLIEDSMNVEHDVEEVGVQTIILVEDSIRYYSSYLPNIYKIILKQSKEFMREGLNEHQKMLRMRGRPKILLATTYEEAIELYERFKYNLLGIISDIRYPRNGTRDPEAGFRLAEKVKSEDENLPILLQSSEVKNKARADEMGFGFLHKYSKTLTIDLRNYIIRQFAFGDFIFRDPENNMKEICRATDLQDLQYKILKIPDKSLDIHAQRNDISKWLNARALFPIAQMFKYVRSDDFNDLSEVRKYIYQAISSYRFSKGRGIIAKFEKNSFDEYVVFSRIGEGSIGGKARGLAFINSLIKKTKIFSRFPDTLITIPRTVVLSTDVFDEFMEINDLYKIGLSNKSDEEILNAFIEARLPGWLHQDLYTYIAVVKNPIAVRSSSKLEDSHYQPFAGIYSTYMIPKCSDSTQTVRLLTRAIKSVYASVFFKSSKAYMTATSNVIDEEKMGIILQEVCGKQYGNRFYPTISGVARSINFYPIAPEKPEDGIAKIAFGLGKMIVDGGVSLRFSPKYPKKVLQLSTLDMTLRDTQKQFYALDLSAESFVPSTDDGINLFKLNIDEAEKDDTLKQVASTYDFQNGVIRPGTFYKGKRLVTFENILKYDTFPLAEIIQTLLEKGQEEMNNPIEIEFAVNMDVPKGQPKIFNFLQIRPIVDNDQTTNFNFESVKEEDTILMSKSALGNGKFENITDVVYVKPESFDPSKTHDIGEKVEQINDRYIQETRNYVLIGPGRWGSSDPWLGIPIKWSQISQAKVIVESGLENYRIDPSQGTHFFQNLTSFRVGYMTINPYIKDGYYDVNFLNSKKAIYEDEFVRIIRFDKALHIHIDGKQNIGAVLKPKELNAKTDNT